MAWYIVVQTLMELKSLRNFREGMDFLSHLYILYPFMGFFHGLLIASSGAKVLYNCTLIGFFVFQYLHMRQALLYCKCLLCHDQSDSWRTGCDSEYHLHFTLAQPPNCEKQLHKFYYSFLQSTSLGTMFGYKG
jgi:hypothetical protein